MKNRASESRQRFFHRLRSQMAKWQIWINPILTGISKRGNVVTSLEDLIEGNSATSSGKLYSKPTRLEHHWEFRCVGFFCWWKHLIRQSHGWDKRGARCSG